MKLHVSAYNGHRQVSTTIKKGLYICVRACWCSVFIDYTFVPLISYTHNGDDTP